MLFQIVKKSDGCDKIIIVGGYEYEKLTYYVNTYLTAYSSKINMVYNPHFKDYGSGYSLLMGIEMAKKYNPDEITFVEGDLFVDDESFKNVLDSTVDVITINREPILSKKAVVAYVDTNNRIKYVYDAAHNSLSIDEPFKAIYNSGQVWKFVCTENLFEVISKLSEKQIQGTNLEIIGTYFSKKDMDNVNVIRFEKWINCNTVKDYDAMLKHIEKG